MTTASAPSSAERHLVMFLEYIYPYAEHVIIWLHLCILKTGMESSSPGLLSPLWLLVTVLMWKLCNVDYQGKAHEKKQKPHFAVELAEYLWCSVSRIIILAQNCHWRIKVAPMCFSESASTYPLLYLSFPRNFSF